MPQPAKTFTTSLERFDSNLWHFHIPVPEKNARKFITGNDKRVICRLNKTVSFQAALMPSGQGDYFININQEIRKKLKLNEGDEVLVELEKDESEYGLPLPEEFKELLKQDPEGNQVFHELTPGKQRTLLYIIGKPKSSALKIRNAIAVLEHLKRNNGQIIYKQLNLDIKNTG